MHRSSKGFRKAIKTCTAKTSACKGCMFSKIKSCYSNKHHCIKSLDGFSRCWMVVCLLHHGPTRKNSHFCCAGGRPPQGPSALRKNQWNGELGSELTVHGFQLIDIAPRRAAGKQPHRPLNSAENSARPAAEQPTRQPGRNLVLCHNYCYASNALLGFV